jgi:hypothetical protein
VLKAIIVKENLSTVMTKMHVLLILATTLKDVFIPMLLLKNAHLLKTNVKNAPLKMHVSLQFALKMQIKLVLANVLLTPVTMEKNAPKILAILPPENAPTFTLFVLSAHLMHNVTRTLIANLGLLRKDMIWTASPLFVMINLVHVKLFQTEINVNQNSARKLAHLETNVKIPLAHMTLSQRNSFAITKERSVTTKTDVLKILVILPLDVSLPLTKLSPDAIPQSANKNLTVLHGQRIATLLTNAKTLSVTMRPKLADLF